MRLQVHMRCRLAACCSRLSKQVSCTKLVPEVGTVMPPDQYHSSAASAAA